MAKKYESIKVAISEGTYTPEEIADFLLLSVYGNRLRARMVLLDRPKPRKPRANDAAIFLAAHLLQKKLKCSDHTALRKLLRGKYRAPYDRLKAQGLTLAQAVRLVQKPPQSF